MPDRDDSVTGVDNAPAALGGHGHGRAGLRRRWIWLLILVLVAGGSGWFLLKLHSAAQPANQVPRAPPPISIRTRAGWRGHIAGDLHGLGTAAPAPPVTGNTRAERQPVSRDY